MNRQYRPTNHGLINRNNQDACKFIERVRKMRALDADPKNVGYSGRELKSFFIGFNK